MNAQLISIFQKLNIRQFLCVALGANKYLAPTIDAIYEENKWEYYAHYKTFDDTLLFERYLTLTEARIRKVAGIVNHSYTNEPNKDTVIKLIKKGYKFVYNYFVKWDKIDLENFLISVNKKYPVKNMPESQLFYMEIVLVYLCNLYEKPINLNNIHGELLIKSFINDLTACGVSLEKYKEELRTELAEEIKELKKEFIPKVIKEYNSIDLLLEGFIIEQSNKLIQEVPRLYEYSEMELGKLEQDIRHEAFRHGFSKFVGTYSGAMKFFGIHEDNITTEYSFSKKELDDILSITISLSKSNKMTEEEMKTFYVSLFFIYPLILAYKEAKSLYLDSSQQELYLEVLQSKEALSKEKALLEKEKQAHKDQLVQLSKEKEGLLAEIEKLKIENKLLKQNSQENTEYKKEAVALRNYLHRNTENINHDIPEKSIDDMVAVLNTKKAVVFGGHIIFLNKLKAKLPGYQYRHLDTLNRDLSFLRNMEYVFVQTGYFKHPYYKKIINEIGNNDVKLIYLPDHANIELVIEEMFDNLVK